MERTSLAGETTPHKRYVSASDFLEAHGYVADGECYIKSSARQYVHLNASEWIGLTLEEFITKAKQRGWVDTAEVEEEERLRLWVDYGKRVLADGQKEAVLAFMKDTMEQHR